MSSGLIPDMTYVYTKTSASSLCDFLRRLCTLFLYKAIVYGSALGDIHFYCFHWVSEGLALSIRNANDTYLCEITKSTRRLTSL